MVETVTSMFENEGAYTDPEARVVVHCRPPHAPSCASDGGLSCGVSFLPTVLRPANLHSILSSWCKMGTGFIPHTAAYTQNTLASDDLFYAEAHCQ